jgi:anti-anti-sigma factor
MDSPASAEILVFDSVTVVRPGAGFSNLYESLLDQLGLNAEFVNSLPAPRLVIDMQHVKFIGSAFIGKMVSLHKTLTPRESGGFALCGLSSFCRAALSIAKLDTVLDVFPTVDDAVAALRMNAAHESAKP